MAERATLVTELRVDDQLTGKLGAAKAQLTQLDATARKAGSSVGGLGSSLGGIAKAGATAFVAFKALDLASDFLGGAIKGAIEEEAGIKRLGQALKENVADWDGNTTAIERTIEARTALGFKDDELRSSFGSLVAATHDVNAAFAIQATAADLARFKNISLEDATARLVKVQAGSFRALKDLGIALKAGASGTAALGEVQKVVAGQAEAFGSTTAGAMARAEAAVDKLSDAVGTKLSGAIKTGADALTNFVNEDVPQFLADTERELQAVRDVLTPVARTGDVVSDSFQELAKGTRDLIGAMRDLASLGGGEVAPSLHDVQGGAVAAGAATLGYIAAERAAAGASADLTFALDGTLKGFLDQREADVLAADALAEYKKFTDLAGDSSAELNNDLLTAANGMLTFAADADTATDAVKRLDDANRAFNVATAPFINPRAAPGTGDADRSQAFSSGGDEGALDQAEANRLARQKLTDDRQRISDDRNEANRRKAEQAADQRLAAAKRRASEEAAAYEKALGRAFDAAKTRANSLFDTLHNRHVQAIRDAETLAEKQHSGALQLISDTLKAQLAVNAGPVSAAQTALNERQQAQGRRGLVESLSAAQVAAQSNTDPEAAADLARALRDATEALENFDDAAKIARLTTVQGTEDAKAQQVADAATLKADAALTAAKAQAQKDLDAETIAAQKRKKDFENALAKLEAADLKAKKSPAEQKADIAKLEERFGITTDPITGFRHITDPLITAIKNIPPSVVNVTFNPVFNAVFQVGARAVAAALASQSSPTSTPMVRTGAAGRS